MTNIVLIQSGGEARVDTRVLAVELGNNHDNVIQLLKKYPADFKEFGILRFETGVIKGRGQPEQFSHLNEDQAYLLLTYVRNSEKARSLKKNLVRAFRAARDKVSVSDQQYLPLYRELHEEVKLLAHRAEECGSTTPERIFHINANKAINAAMGIASGERGTLTIEQRLLLTNIQLIFKRALHESLEAGDTHREAAAKAKAAALNFVQVAGTLIAGSKAA
jgi:phage regulator Rha-like protein